MQVIHDYYIIAVDKKYESTVTKSGIITLNDAYMEEWAEEALSRRRCYGTVLTVPLSFNDTVIDVIAPGMPEPRIFVSGEHIAYMLQHGYGVHYAPTYVPSTYDEMPKITLADIAAKVDVKPKDKIYFDYMVTNEENFLGKHGEADMWLCRVDKIYAVVRDGKIIPQGGWCMVKPDMETWEDITLPSGIIKKPQPEARYLLGYISHVSDRDDLKPGDHIVYQRDADCVMKIEGEEYYVMKESDVLCRV